MTIDMKNLLKISATLAAMMMLSSANTYAGSFDKSRFFIGGQLGISATSQDSGTLTTSVSSFSLSPEAGYLLNNNKWIVGLRLSYDSIGCMNATSTASIGDIEISIDGSSNYNAIGFRPYAMYNCFSVGPVAFWLEGGSTISVSSRRLTSFHQVTPIRMFWLADTALPLPAFISAQTLIHSLLSAIFPLASATGFN